LRVESSCAFTSLSTDMQRSKASHRGWYEQYMVRIYAMFRRRAKAAFFRATQPMRPRQKPSIFIRLWSETLTMARTMKDPKRASRDFWKREKKYLIRAYS